MEVSVHFLNGNSASMELHYSQKEYRDDVIVEIDKRFYEVYFWDAGAIQNEMTNEGFFSFPGMIILDEISSEKILNAISILTRKGFFDYFSGNEIMPVNNRFGHRWYLYVGPDSNADYMETIRLEC